MKTKKLVFITERTNNGKRQVVMTGT